MRDTLRIGSRGSDVRQLQTMLNAVGDNIVVDGEFGERTFHSVCDFQSWQKLEPDGIVGPKTWQALTDAIARRDHEAKKAEAKAAAPKTDHDLQIAGEDAIDSALGFWHMDIYDPKVEDGTTEGALCKTIIDSFIRSDDGIGWSWRKRYPGDHDFEWCGAFAASCWGAAIKAELRKLYFASTYRLDRYASYQSFNGETNAGSGRLYAKLDEKSTELPFDPRPGDILLIGPKGYGQHICLVEDFDGSAFHTVEGNGNGFGPHGERQHGVVRARRALGAKTEGAWCARRLIRPSVEDLA